VFSSFLKRLLIYAIIATGICWALVAHAQTNAGQVAPGAFDLLQVWQAAKQRDPDYAAAQALHRAERERPAQARAQLLPAINLAASGQHMDTRAAATLGNSSTSRLGAWNLILTQPLWHPSRREQLRQSEYQAQLAAVTLQQAYQDLALRVTRAYFDVLAAQDMLTTLAAQKQAVNSQLRAVQASFELGGTTIADVFEAQARLDLLNATQLQAENALQISQDRLAQIIHERPQQLAGLAPALNLPAPQPRQIDEWSQQAEQSSLTVAGADLTVRIVQKQLDIATSGHSPTLNLQAQTGSASNRGINGINQGRRSLDSSIGVQLSIPVFSGGGISSQVREQAHRLQNARQRLESARRQAVQTSRQAFSQVTSGLAQISTLQAAERSSQASVRANQTGYAQGVRTNIDVLNAQQQFFETRRTLLRTRYDTLMASLQLKAASGVLDEADMVAINQLLAF